VLPLLRIVGPRPSGHHPVHVLERGPRVYGVSHVHLVRHHLPDPGRVVRAVPLVRPPVRAAKPRRRKVEEV
ncbi:hypothetical protein CH063_11614, partial [Colletotrichum higginsianum]